LNKNPTEEICVHCGKTQCWEDEDIIEGEDTVCLFKPLSKERLEEMLSGSFTNRRRTGAQIASKGNRHKI